MPKVNISVDSKYNAKETYEKVKNVFDQAEDIKKFDPTLTCDFDPDNNSCKAKGSKFSATMNVNESGNNTTVDVIVDLPLLLSPLKGQVKAKVEQKLKSILA